MPKHTVTFSLALPPQTVFDICRKAVAESGLQTVSARPPILTCKESSPTSLNSWGGVAQPVLMQIQVSQGTTGNANVTINGSLWQFISGHVESRVVSLQNRIIVEARQYADAQTARAPAPSTGFIAELEKLAALRQAGHLTEDEFQKAKTKLLG